MATEKSPRTGTVTSSENRILELWHIFFNLDFQEFAMFGVNSWSEKDSEGEALGDISKGTRGLMPLLKYLNTSYLHPSRDGGQAQVCQGKETEQETKG